MKEMEGQWFGGSSPYDRYWIHSMNGGQMDIRRGDLITDEHNTDPLTGQLTLYRVVGNVRNYDNTYYLIPADKYVSTRTDGH